ncbi:DUF6886 family protein [Methylocapsa sp. S129]|uniref:DUF6886 family protein n=1 Tax=Methylocapsa sp. S129 TaxID=1641869 RepID=UPI00131C5923|nr:DUF6886 family protein [Methylocapsa sp. S129]
MRLFHFSDDPNIKIFTPRPVRVAVDRPAGQEWLNGPLVWATSEAFELLYLFPRECPRIVIWPTPETSPEEKQAWFGDGSRRAIAHIERVWFERLRAGVIYRYELPVFSFEDVDEVGMWVSRIAVKPDGMEAIVDMLAELDARNIELRVMEKLTPLKDIWGASLHASGIRLRNAQDWGKPGWTHSKPGRPVVVSPSES